MVVLALYVLLLKKTISKLYFHLIYSLMEAMLQIREHFCPQRLNYLPDIFLHHFVMV